MSAKGQHFRESMNIKKYQENKFWDNSNTAMEEKRDLFTEVMQGIDELKEERVLTQEDKSDTIPTDQSNGEKK